MELRTTSFLYRLRWWGKSTRPPQEDLWDFASGLADALTYRPLLWFLTSILFILSFALAAVLALVIIGGFSLLVLPFGVRIKTSEERWGDKDFTFADVDCTPIKAWPLGGTTRVLWGLASSSIIWSSIIAMQCTFITKTGTLSIFMLGILGVSCAAVFFSFIFALKYYFYCEGSDHYWERRRKIFPTVTYIVGTSPSR